MNEEDVTKLLDDVVPAAPSVKGWAGRASGRVRRRRVVTGALAAVVALGVPVGLTISQQGAGPLEATPQPADSSTPVETQVPLPPGEVELTGDVMIIQMGDAPPNLCMGPIFAVYPPSCSGPTLKGEFSWNDIGHTTMQTDGPDASEDRTWTESNHTVVGHFDPDDGEQGSFTLTRLVALPSMTPEPSDSPEYPALCDDPLRGGDPTKADVDATNLFTAELAKIPTVGWWVSNGLDFYNVLVPGDAEAVHAQLRTVWGGELCVETSNAPTEADRLEVLEQIRTQLPPNRYLGGSGGTPLDTVVELHVTVEDHAVRDVVESRARTDVEVRTVPVFTPVTTPPTSRAPEPSSDTPGPDPMACTTVDADLITVEDVVVRLVDAGGPSGLAESEAQRLEEHGFRILGVTQSAEGKDVVGTIIRANPKDVPATRLVTSYYKDTTFEPDERTDGTVDVVIGSEFAGYGDHPLYRASTGEDSTYCAPKVHR